MHQTSAVSHPSWKLGLPGGNGSRRRSPVEVVATAATYVTHNPVASLSGLRVGPLGRWADGPMESSRCAGIVSRSPAKLFADLRALIGAVPDGTVLLDLPLPTGIWGIIGRASVPYVTRINQTIRQAAGARGLAVAEISAHFLPPWTGKFAGDCFHPSQDGYRDWAQALLAAIPAAAPAI
jgi:hypothetical protein